MLLLLRHRRPRDVVPLVVMGMLSPLQARVVPRLPRPRHVAHGIVDRFVLLVVATREPRSRGARERPRVPLRRGARERPRMPLRRGDVQDFLRKVLDAVLHPLEPGRQFRRRYKEVQKHDACQDAQLDGANS